MTVLTKLEAGQTQWLDHWATRIHGSGLAVIALPVLEIARGVGFLASQALLLLQPVLAGLVDATNINRCLVLLEDPAMMEGLIERIEQKAKNNG
jgi:hypothetical protein